MLRAHELARLVAADRDQRQVEAAAVGEMLADVGEIAAVAGVSGVDQPELRRQHRESAPERALSVEGRAAGPVPGGRQHELDAALDMRLPPVQLDHPQPGQAQVVEPGLELQRHDEQRRAARLCCQRPHRGLVEVVIVVVRDQHHVDVRQLRGGERQRADPLRPGPGHRRGALGELRVGQHRQTAEPRQHRRVADPGDAGLGRLQVGCDHRQRRLRARRILAAQLPAPDLPLRLVDGAAVAVAKALGGVVGGSCGGSRRILPVACSGPPGRTQAECGQQCQAGRPEPTSAALHEDEALHRTRLRSRRITACARSAHLRSAPPAAPRPAPGCPGRPRPVRPPGWSCVRA